MSKAEVGALSHTGSVHTGCVLHSSSGFFSPLMIEYHQYHPEIAPYLLRKRKEHRRLNNSSKRKRISFSFLIAALLLSSAASLYGQANPDFSVKVERLGITEDYPQTVVYTVEFCNTGKDLTKTTIRPVDIVWIVDSSASMRTFIKSVAGQARKFARILKDAPFEWRLAVTDLCADGSYSDTGCSKPVTKNLRRGRPRKGTGDWVTEPGNFEMMIDMDAPNGGCWCSDIIYRSPEVYSHYTFQEDASIIFVGVSDFCPKEVLGMAANGRQDRPSKYKPEDAWWEDAVYVERLNFFKEKRIKFYAFTLKWPYNPTAIENEGCGKMKKYYIKTDGPYSCLYWHGEKGMCAQTGGKAYNLCATDWQDMLIDLANDIVERVEYVESRETAANLSISFPDAFSYVLADAPVTETLAGPKLKRIEWPISSLKAGECTTITITLRVSSLDPPETLDFEVAASARGIKTSIKDSVTNIKRRPTPVILLAPTRTPLPTLMPTNTPPDTPTPVPPPPTPVPTGTPADTPTPVPPPPTNTFPPTHTPWPTATWVPISVEITGHGRIISRCFKFKVSNTIAGKKHEYSMREFKRIEFGEPGGEDGPFPVTLTTASGVTRHDDLLRVDWQDGTVQSNILVPLDGNRENLSLIAETIKLDVADETTFLGNYVLIPMSVMKSIEVTTDPKAMYIQNNIVRIMLTLVNRKTGDNTIDAEIRPAPIYKR